MNVKAELQQFPENTKKLTFNDVIVEPETIVRKVYVFNKM